MHSSAHTLDRAILIIKIVLDNSYFSLEKDGQNSILSHFLEWNPTRIFGPGRFGGVFLRNFRVAFDRLFSVNLGKGK